MYFVNKNSLRKRPQKLVLKSPRKEAFIVIVKRQMRIIFIDPL